MGFAVCISHNPVAVYLLRAQCATELIATFGHNDKCIKNVVYLLSSARGENENERERHCGR